jgi:hypothetical protein
MKICGSIEQKKNAEATSSYHPLPFQLSQGSIQSQGSVPSKSRSSRYLPVHYFDYVGKKLL